MYNHNKDINIKLNDDMSVLFYNEYSDFSLKFLEHLYTTWIDTYIIRENEFTSLILLDDDFSVKGYNISFQK